MLQIAQKYIGRLNLILLLSTVAFYFSAKSVAYVVIFWLSMADSFWNCAAVDLCCPSSQKWFLMHAWPTALLVWGCAAGDAGFSTQPWVFRMKKWSRWPFLLFSAVFLSCLSWAGYSCQQEALVACLQLSQYAGTLFWSWQHLCMMQLYMVSCELALAF